MPSIVDISGKLNGISTLRNASAATARMAFSYHTIVSDSADSSSIRDILSRVPPKRIAMTGFGPTALALHSAMVHLATYTNRETVFLSMSQSSSMRQVLVSAVRSASSMKVGSFRSCDGTGRLLRRRYTLCRTYTRASPPQVALLTWSILALKFYEHKVDIIIMPTSVAECQALGAEIARKLAVPPTETALVTLSGSFSSIDYQGGGRCFSSE
ncbi:hypothetical protein BS47DRAFT_962245 [Hydnum rufescens UP504]|uniref:Uncharacterized protein n=1 Tax=Hydnum rufescens UP504 TaxID=1448309 RepID=A0A9P6AWV9_9AGAM|nr:hypothetical protein BS47DRAFT_962245 [Hydnum rufescens UP504]